MGVHACLVARNGIGVLIWIRHDGRRGLSLAFLEMTRPPTETARLIASHLSGHCLCN